MATAINLARKIIKSLDRLGLRWTLATAYFAIGKSRKDWVDALWYDRGWVHRFGEDYLVEVRPRLRAPELSESRIQNYCGHLYVPRAGDTVIDAGAGYGWEAIRYARKVAKSGRVIALEAHPVVAGLMARAVELSGLKQVQVINLAIADSARTLFLDNNLDDHVGNKVSETAIGDTITVEAKSLDQLCSELEIGRIDFIKMNIEGAEQLAIHGMTDIIKRTGVVAISCHDFVYEMTGNEFFRTRQIVESWLAEKGFVVVPRQANDPALKDQINAFNPAMVDATQLNPAAMGMDIRPPL